MAYIKDTFQTYTDIRGVSYSNPYAIVEYPILRRKSKTGGVDVLIYADSGSKSFDVVGKINVRISDEFFDDYFSLEVLSSDGADPIKKAYEYVTEKTSHMDGWKSDEV